MVVGIIVCGAGYMGRENFLEGSLPLLIPELKKSRISCNYVYVIEPDKKTRKNLEKYNKGLDFEDYGTFSTHLELFDYIERNQIIKKLNFLLFYDASPTSGHYDNMSVLSSFSKKYGIESAYLGEKPLCADVTGIKDMNRLPYELIFCELIEMVNPVFLKVKDYIENKNLEILELYFWRAGSSALKKVIGTDRAGIQGGALLDKSPHDFSISVGLLGVDSIDDKEVEPNLEPPPDKVGPENPIKPIKLSFIEDVKANIHYFSIHQDFFVQKKRCFLDARNYPLYEEEFNKFLKEWKIGPKPLIMPADGLFSCSFNWKIKDNRKIKATYLFSWIGVVSNIEERKFISEEEIFIKKFKKFGLESKMWLDYQYQEPKVEWFKKELQTEDVRIDLPPN
jgi:hypothetical protein